MKKQNGKNRTKMCVVVAIIFLYALLFFVLRNKLVITPDFVGSDAFHVNYSLKHYLSSSLRAGQFPFWTDLIQGGFPLFAEGQIGALFIPNIIASFICNSSSIYFFLLLVSVLFLTLGMFFLFQQEEVSLIASLLLSLNFAWIGSITFAWVHLTIIQTFSLVPFLYLIYFKWIKTRKHLYGFILSLLLSQMYFAGNIQIVFISLLGMGVYSLFNKNRKEIIGGLVLWVGLGTLFAFPQLLPSYQLHTLSSRSEVRGYAFAVSVPFKVQNLLGYIFYDHMGNPKTGSYPLLWNKEGIFWENTPYVGLLFFCAFILSLIYAIKVKTKDNTYIPYLLVAFFFVLLALGDSSPIYFLFDLFPFTLFRVTGRFLFIASLFVFLAMGILMKIALKSKRFILLICLLLLVNFFQLVYVAFDYNLLADEKKIVNSITSFVNKLPNKSSLYMVGLNDAWLSKLKSAGWNTKVAVKDFTYLYQFPLSNSNLLSGTPSLNQGNVGLTLRRADTVSTYLESMLKDANLSLEKRNNGLSLYNVGTVISFNSKKINTYKVDAIVHGATSSRLYIPERLKKVEYMSDINMFLSEGAISEQNGIVENHPTVLQEKQNIRVLKSTYTDQLVEATVYAKKDGFLVFKKSWYPEWSAFVDGRAVPLYKTNINHMGIDIPSGRHSLKLLYIPRAFLMGGAIGIGSFLLCAIFLIRKRVKKNEG